jgi:hypothetical protein
VFSTGTVPWGEMGNGGNQHPPKKANKKKDQQLQHAQYDFKTFECFNTQSVISTHTSVILTLTSVIPTRSSVIFTHRV